MRSDRASPSGTAVRCWSCSSSTMSVEMKAPAIRPVASQAPASRGPHLDELGLRGRGPAAPFSTAAGYPASSSRDRTPSRSRPREGSATRTVIAAAAPGRPGRVQADVDRHQAGQQVVDEVGGLGGHGARGRARPGRARGRPRRPLPSPCASAAHDRRTAPRSTSPPGAVRGGTTRVCSSSCSVSVMRPSIPGWRQSPAPRWRPASRPVLGSGRSSGQAELLVDKISLLSKLVC